MAYYKCIQDNQYNGLDSYRSGRIYDLTPTPPTAFFEAVSQSELDNNVSDWTPLPARRDLEGDWHVDSKLDIHNDLASNSLSTHYIDFNLTPIVEFAEGITAWSEDEGTLSTGMPGSDVTLNHGMEMFIPRRVINKTGSDMSNGQLVYISGGSGSNSYVSLAKADAAATSESTIAMLTEDIANNARGYATILGLVRGSATEPIDSSAGDPGDALYLSADTAGAFTPTMPTHPNYNCKVGIVFRKHATEGAVIVNIEEPICACKVAGGDNATWDDLRFPATRVRRGALNKPDFDYTNIGLLFPQDDATEETYVIAQMPHKWLLESALHSHIHYIQDEAEQPTFKMDYRIIQNGGAPPGTFTTISTADGNKGVYSYTSGSLSQIATFPAIDMTGVDGVSAILDIIVYRDDDDVTGDVLVKEFDIHYQIDSLGSRTEFAKG